jgi:hypothetical protein
VILISTDIVESVKSKRIKSRYIRLLLYYKVVLGCLSILGKRRVLLRRLLGVGETNGFMDENVPLQNLRGTKTKFSYYICYFEVTGYWCLPLKLLLGGSFDFIDSSASVTLVKTHLKLRIGRQIFVDGEKRKVFCFFLLYSGSNTYMLHTYSSVKGTICFCCGNCDAHQYVLR